MNNSDQTIQINIEHITKRLLTTRATTTRRIIITPHLFNTNTSRQNVICHSCNTPGHITPNCPNKRRFQNNNTTNNNNYRTPPSQGPTQNPRQTAFETSNGKPYRRKGSFKPRDPSKVLIATNLVIIPTIVLNHRNDIRKHHHHRAALSSHKIHIHNLTPQTQRLTHKDHIVLRFNPHVSPRSHKTTQKIMNFS
jgi:hypothetical protein